jgi:hypothetical protein
VVPLCEQLRAQHKRAVEISGVRLAAWAAFLQQSMPVIPGMLHSCSLECSGIPAAALAPTAKISRRLVSFFNIAIANVVKYSKACQDQSSGGSFFLSFI